MLSFQANANTAIAGISWFEEQDAGLIERLLDAGQRAGTRVCSATLKVFDSDLRDARRLGEVHLRPANKGACSAYLDARNHLLTIGVRLGDGKQLAYF